MAIVRTCLGLIILLTSSSLGTAVASNNEAMSRNFPAVQRTAKQLYRKQCASCHGPDGRALTSKGKFSHARDLSDAKWQDDVTDERIFNSIMNGRSVRGNMPAFSDKLNEKEAESLVSFVRKFKG